MNIAPEVILVIDRDPDFFRSIATQLEAPPYTVMMAGNFRQARQLAVRQPLGLILMDWGVARGDETWVAVLKKLKNDPITADIPILLTSLRARIRRRTKSRKSLSATDRRKTRSRSARYRFLLMKGKDRLR